MEKRIKILKPMMSVHTYPQADIPNNLIQRVTNINFNTDPVEVRYYNPDGSASYLEQLQKDDIKEICYNGEIDRYLEEVNLHFSDVKIGGIYNTLVDDEQEFERVLVLSINKEVAPGFMFGLLIDQVGLKPYQINILQLLITHHHSLFNSATADQAILEVIEKYIEPGYAESLSENLIMWDKYKEDYIFSDTAGEIYFYNI